MTAQREDQGMGSASPRPESFGDEEMTGQKRRIRGDKSLVDGEGEGMEDGGSDDDDGEEGIATMMGFGGFGTTKVRYLIFYHWSCELMVRRARAMALMRMAQSRCTSREHGGSI